MAFLKVRSKLSSILMNKPTLSQYVGIYHKQPKPACVFLADSSLCRSFSTNRFLPTFVRIPYSGKFCFASPEIFSPSKNFIERASDIMNFRILPSSDKRVMEVESVARNMIGAMNEGLMLDKPYKINGHVYEPPPPKKSEHTTPTWKLVTEHLNGREWDFYVVRRLPFDYLSSGFFGQKIMISTKLLKRNITEAEREAEIATAVGYEIGKVVCKSRLRSIFMLEASLVTTSLLIGVIDSTALLLVLFPAMMVFAFPLRCFLSNRIVSEAAGIGLILMASAGYNPLQASMSYLRHTYGELFAIEDIETIIRNNVMEEAVEIYEEVENGKGVRKFV